MAALCGAQNRGKKYFFSIDIERTTKQSLPVEYWHIISVVKTILQGTVKEGRRQTDKEVGRQHQGMDRPGVRQVPEGSGEQGKMEDTGCEVICGASTTLAFKGLMMMMICLMMKICFQANLYLCF